MDHTFPMMINKINPSVNYWLNMFGTNQPIKIQVSKIFKKNNKITELKTLGTSVIYNPIILYLQHKNF